MLLVFFLKPWKYLQSSVRNVLLKDVKGDAVGANENGQVNEELRFKVVSKRIKELNYL